MDKLKLFNAIITVVTPLNSNNAHANSLDDELKNTGLDSLDMIMMGMYLSDVYGVPEEIVKDIKPITVNDMMVFMETHKTKELPKTVEEALETLK